jgi:hypothetical protein
VHNLLNPDKGESGVFILTPCPSPNGEGFFSRRLHPGGDAGRKPVRRLPFAAKGWAAVFLIFEL